MTIFADYVPITFVAQLRWTILNTTPRTAEVFYCLHGNKLPEKALPFGPLELVTQLGAYAMCLEYKVRALARCRSKNAKRSVSCEVECYIQTNLYTTTNARSSENEVLVGRIPLYTALHKKICPYIFNLGIIPLTRGHPPRPSF